MAGDVARMDLAAYFRSVRHHAWRLSRPERQGLVAWFSQALMGKTCLRRNFVGAGLSFRRAQRITDSIMSKMKKAGGQPEYPALESSVQSVSRSERANGAELSMPGPNLVRSFVRGCRHHWHDRERDSPRDTHQLSNHSSAPDRSYSAAGDGYFERCDGGDTRQRFEEGLRHRYLWSIAVDTADPNKIVLSAASSAQHSHFELANRTLSANSRFPLATALRRPARANWTPQCGSGRPSERVGDFLCGLGV